MIHVVAGLGNPGDEYASTRHNVGFMLADALAADLGVGFRKTRWQLLLAQADMGEVRVYIVKPQAYMNRSGEPIASLLRYYSLAPQNLLVAHDDLDLSCGRIKMSLNGGDGGHKGIRSIIQHLATRDFSRIKMGIGHPRDSEETHRVPVERYVLGRFSEREYETVTVLFPLLIDGIRIFISRGSGPAMNKVNSIHPAP